MSSRARIAIVIGAVALLIVAFVIASSAGNDDKSSDDRAAATATTSAPAPAATDGTQTATTAAPAEPRIPVVTVKDAKPVGGVKRLTFTKGDTIRFTVKSDTADEIHFHGYDVHEDVKAGGQVTFSVPGKIEGRFVVELEDHGTQIAEVEVDPS
jgi:hypothetical protein